MLPRNESGEPCPAAESESAEWSRLSIPSFARDWDSDADEIYDDQTIFEPEFDERV
jgi:hypothetical protein